MTAQVTVLLPVYNGATTLAACLKSIARQSHRNFHCLIVDDGSKDNSTAIARKFTQQDPRFHLYQRPHHGLVEALNFGLSQTDIEFVARMDGDDIMHRHRLALQLQHLQGHQSLTAVGCHVRLFPRQSLGPGIQEYESWLNSIRTPEDVQREAYVECPLAHPTLMARREALHYRAQGWPEDYDLILRLLQQGHSIGVVPKRLLAWRHQTQRLSQTHAHYDQEEFTRCKAAFLASGFLQQENRYILWGYGKTGKMLRRALSHHHKQVAFIVELHPGRLGETIHGAPVVSPQALNELPRLPTLVSVAGADSRQIIRQQFRAMNRRELQDFVCVA